MLRAKRGPSGRKICFWRPPPLSQSLDDCPPPPPPLLIWRSGSVTAYPAILTEQTCSINDLLHGQKEKVLGERLVGKDKSIFPARAANHDQNTGFASPCPLVESAIYNLLFIWSFQVLQVSDKQPVKFLKYIDLARTKSEALDNIYSLFKQNIKSGNAKRRRQRRRTVKDNNRSN